LEPKPRIVVAILLAGLLAQTFNIVQTVQASNPYFSVDTSPNPYRASAVGEKFNVNVTIYELSNDSGCYDAAFELAYNHTVIHVTSYTLDTLWGTNAVNDSAGILQVDVSNPSSTPSGDVLVITIQFVVLIQGIFPVEYRSTLKLLNTRLLGNGGNISINPPVDGLVIVTPRLPASTAAFTWYPSTPRANRTVTFDGTDSTPGWNGTGYPPIVNYTWDFGDSNFTSAYYPSIVHTYTAAGNYTVNLKVTDADGFQANATHLVSVQQSMPIGDINGDGVVDIYDAIQMANAFNTTPSSPKWNPNADLNCDGAVDIYDAIILANHFGQHL
jgi:PKD repeat protein